MGNLFHQLWQQAETGEGDYEAVFLPWYWQEEYIKDVSDDFTLTLAVDSRITSVPGASGTACMMPAMCSSAWGQKPVSEPWKSWIVEDRPVALVYRELGLFSPDST